MVYNIPTILVTAFVFTGVARNLNANFLCGQQGQKGWAYRLPY